VGGGSCSSGIGASGVVLPSVETSPLSGVFSEAVNRCLRKLPDTGRSGLSVTFFFLLPVLISHVTLCVASVTVYFRHTPRICQVAVIFLQCLRYYRIVGISPYTFHLFSLLHTSLSTYVPAGHSGDLLSAVIGVAKLTIPFLANSACNFDD
jgi:hypothetical protein